MLAGLWILDGLLQLQPKMFTQAMVQSILGPLSAGQPGWVQAVVRLSTQVISANVVIANGLIALIQLCLGAALLLRGGQRRWPLWASLAWAVGLWIFGQAFGGLAAGQASLLAGGPGSAVLYALLIWAAWPLRDPAADAARRRRVALALGALWALGAVLQALPANYAASTGLPALVGGLAAGQPGWLAALLHWGSGLLGRAPGTANALTVALMALTAAGIWWGGALLRPALLLSVVLSAAAWVFGQAFGMMLTGLSTDPNSAPLYAIVALFLWTAPRDAGGRATA